MKKLCYVATIPDVVYSFLKDHIDASAKKWQVTVVTHPKDSGLLRDLDARLIPLDIRRKAAPLHDLAVLFRLTMLFRRERFDLVHSIMPKTGLLAMLAARLAGVPVRMHTFTGQVWANRRGWKRRAYKTFDRLIAAFATHILVDSPSQRDFLVAEGVLPRGKGEVIGHGSICGIDARRFRPDAQARAAVRAELGIGLEQTVILFLGRLNRDKGMLDLAAAFTTIASRRGDVELVLVGSEEDVPFARVQEICGEYRERLHRMGFTPYPERYMAAADIFCLPSYREGFGQVIIEAAACAVPTVASRIYGITDAMEDGTTGLQFPAGDVDALVGSLQTLLTDAAMRRKMGASARERALKLFDSGTITAELMKRYEELMR
ncbi:MAG TPA: glycosyltransferase [Gallionella sp.]|nr:glycosyltransferase [Gallionella sp.]